MLSSLLLSYLSLSVRNAKQLLFATFGCRLLPLSLLASPSGYRYFFTCDSASSMQPASNQSMKPAAPFRCNFAELATNPARGLSLLVGRNRQLHSMEKEAL